MDSLTCLRNGYTLETDFLFCYQDYSLFCLGVENDAFTVSTVELDGSVCISAFVCGSAFVCCVCC